MNTATSNRPLFTEAVARVWCKRHAAEHRDPRTNEINHTALAEACADAFSVNDAGGPLDDPDHWIWDVALIEG